MKRIYVCIIAIVVATSLSAQQSVNTTGGKTTGSYGSISYSIGQVVYHSTTGSSGNSITEGVQQPIIEIISQIKGTENIKLEILAYPNPTTDLLTVSVKNYKTDNLRFQIYDISGKLIRSVEAKGEQTQIKISELTQGSYFIKVIDNQREIKVFKIIKN